VEIAQYHDVSQNDYDYPEQIDLLDDIQIPHQPNCSYTDRYEGELEFRN